MRILAPSLLLLTACGGGPSLLGAWQFDMQETLQDPGGTPMTVVVPVPVHLVQGAKTAVAWKVGGCSLDLQVVGEVATLTLPAPTCTLTVDDVPLASQLHLVTLGHLLIPSVAHFEVTRTAKPNQANYTFNPDEDGLSMNLEFTIRAQVDSPSFSTFTVSPTKVFGHRLP